MPVGSSMISILHEPKVMLVLNKKIKMYFKESNTYMSILEMDNFDNLFFKLSFGISISACESSIHKKVGSLLSVTSVVVSLLEGFSCSIMLSLNSVRKIEVFFRLKNSSFL